MVFVSSLQLYALGIDEFRDMFGASAELAIRLREAAARRFPSNAPTAAGLLGKLGPVLRRPVDAPVTRPDYPNGNDVDALLAGRYLPPQRLAAGWALLEAWLAELARGTHHRDIAVTDLDDLDFALVRAGAGSQYGLRHLLTSDLAIPLLPCPGLAAGWVDHEHLAAMAAAWAAALDQLDEHQQDLARPILAWLEQYPGWTAAAEAERRQPPDLVSVLRC